MYNRQLLYNDFFLALIESLSISVYDNVVRMKTGSTDFHSLQYSC